MNVLVLGGYGLIGEAIVDRLVADGASVAGLGRDVVQASRRKPQVLWIQADLARLTEASAWMVVLEGVEVVVNAAGALQDGARDDVRVVHELSMRALYAACADRGIRRVVQISAVGVSPDADTAFLRTKAAGDAALAASGLDHVILRPGLVIGAGAYGGTALLRALAGFPLVTPLVLAERPIQTVAVADVAEATARAVAGKFPSGTVLDLVEDRGHSLAHLVASFRAWLGYRPARTIVLPAWLGTVAAKVADGLGWLDWRSPFRTTAMRAVTGGVVGDPEPYRALTGQGVADLAATLAALPSTVQERWFARMWLLKPAILFTLSLFWLVSGLVGLFRSDAAAAILTARGVGAGFADAAVLLGSLADILLGLVVLARKTARAALLAMIAVTLAYLLGAALLAPDLWLDPLGAMVKSVPAMVLALVGLAVLEER